MTNLPTCAKGSSPRLSLRVVHTNFTTSFVFGTIISRRVRPTLSASVFGRPCDRHVTIFTLCSQAALELTCTASDAGLFYGSPSCECIGLVRRGRMQFVRKGRACRDWDAEGAAPGSIRGSCFFPYCSHGTGFSNLALDMLTSGRD